MHKCTILGTTNIWRVPRRIEYRRMLQCKSTEAEGVEKVAIHTHVQVAIHTYVCIATTYICKLQYIQIHTYMYFWKHTIGSTVMRRVPRPRGSNLKSPGIASGLLTRSIMAGQPASISMRPTHRRICPIEPCVWHDSNIHGCDVTWLIRVEMDSSLEWKTRQKGNRNGEDPMRANSVRQKWYYSIK